MSEQEPEEEPEEGVVSDAPFDEGAPQQVPDDWLDQKPFDPAGR